MLAVPGHRHRPAGGGGGLRGDQGAAGLERRLLPHPTTPEGIPGGGVSNAIVGTAEIGFIATAVTVPLGSDLRPVPGRLRGEDRLGRPVHRRRHDRGPLDHHRHLRLHRHRQDVRLQRAGRRLRHRDRHAAGDHPGRGDRLPGRAPQPQRGRARPRRPQLDRRPAGGGARGHARGDHRHPAGRGPRAWARRRRCC